MLTQWEQTHYTKKGSEKMNPLRKIFKENSAQSIPPEIIDSYMFQWEIEQVVKWLTEEEKQGEMHRIIINELIQKLKQYP